GLVAAGPSPPRGEGRKKSLDLLHPAAADLAAADDVEAERVEAGQVGVAQHIRDIVKRQRLPLVQADEDVAAADAGPGGGAVRLDSRHLQPAVQLPGDPRDQLALPR